MAQKKTKTGTNQTSEPVTVAGGYVLAPGEGREVDPKDPHNAGLLAAGVLHMS